MGIKGLLVFAKDGTRQVHVSEFSNSTAAIDAYSWIYKGAFATAMEIMLDKDTRSLEHYLDRRLSLLLSVGIRPIMVFDGRNLPSKGEVDFARRESRQANLSKGHELLRERGRRDPEVRNCFRSAFEVTFEIARSVMDWLSNKQIEFLVAPYEADAQLTFLSLNGLVEIVISEDSDLIPFGCKKILYKLEDSGYGVLVEESQFQTISKLGNMFTLDRLRWMCIMAGCDYFRGIPGIGLTKARKLLMQIRSQDLREVLRCVRVQLSRTAVLDDDFETRFARADLTFKHQVVFDVRFGKLRYLRDTDDFLLKGIAELGEFFGDELAIRQSKGMLDYSKLENSQTVHNDEIEDLKFRNNESIVQETKQKVELDESLVSSTDSKPPKIQKETFVHDKNQETKPEVKLEESLVSSTDSKPTNTMISSKSPYFTGQFPDPPTQIDPIPPKVKK